NVRVQHPVHVPPVDPGRQRVQRIMRAAPWPEPAGETPEVRLTDGAENLDDGPLGNLVFQRGNAERPLPPVRLRDVRPPARRRPVAPLLHPCVQALKVSFQVLPVGCPRHPVYPRCGLRADRPVRPPQAANGDVVQERGEPCLLIPYCHLPHTIQLTWHTWPGTASGACFAARVPLGSLPFLPRLRSRSPVRRVRRYYEAIRLPVTVHPRITAPAFPERPDR